MSLDDQLLVSLPLTGIPQLDAGKLPLDSCPVCSRQLHCNVGIQQILKHAMKKTALSHIVKETVIHLTNNEDPGMILLAKTIGFSETDQLSGL
jgi:hypothetical protein